MSSLRESKAMSAERNPTIPPLLQTTRRHFFEDCRVGLGAVALSSLLNRDLHAGRSAVRNDPLAPKAPHFPPRAKAVIYLFMAGGPSQLDLFSYKPQLEKYDGQMV